MNTEQPSRNQTKVLRVLRAFAVKVQPRIHREAAKISRRKILSCQQRIFGLVAALQKSRDCLIRISSKRHLKQVALLITPCVHRWFLCV